MSFYDPASDVTQCHFHHTLQATHSRGGVKDPSSQWWCVCERLCSEVVKPQQRPRSKDTCFLLLNLAFLTILLMYHHRWNCVSKFRSQSLDPPSPAPGLEIPSEQVQSVQCRGGQTRVGGSLIQYGQLLIKGGNLDPDRHAHREKDMRR